MKGILLPSGTGSRLSPLTAVTTKHLLPVGNYPVVFHPIPRLKQASIKDILVVTRRDHMGDVMELLGSGHDFGLDFTYKVQDQAGGIAQALGLARGFCCGDACCVILGDNIFHDDLTSSVEASQGQGRGARVLLKEVQDPQRFGVAELSQDGHILSIEEKPANPKSSRALVGIFAGGVVGRQLSSRFRHLCSSWRMFLLAKKSFMSMCWQFIQRCLPNRTTIMGISLLEYAA